MDQKAIGQYIAEKRKKYGFTQDELGDKLGVTGKAVSKWETGRSMPDVSVMPELCEILGFSINELFAGQDIGAEEMVVQAEKNMVGIFAQGIANSNKFKVIIILLATLLVTVLCVSLYAEYSGEEHMTSYIDAYEEGSPESTIANLCGMEGFVVNPFCIGEKCEKLIIYSNVFYHSKLISQSRELTLHLDDNDFASGECKGIVGFSCDYSHKEINIVASTGGTTVKEAAPIQDYLTEAGVKNQGLTIVGPENLRHKVKLTKGEFREIFAVSFDDDDSAQGGTLGSYLAEPDKLEENDVTIIYTMEWK